ncbi:AEC family transporter [Candidatus Saccharibacteria bacterium]|jgi:predicted permease|nr:AEC family transporter [Candidatus Saccharibacteria bacterium]
MATIIALVAVALLGGIVSRRDMVSHLTKARIQKYVYFFAAPIAVIYALGNHDFSDNSRYLAFLIINAGSYAVLFFVTYIILKKKKVSRKLAGVIAFSSNAPNTVFLGFPLVLALFGQEAFVYVALLGSLSDAFLNALRLFMLHKYKAPLLRREKHSRAQLRSIIKETLTNPFLVALAIGGIISYLHVPVPSGLRLIGLSASYAALFALGLSVGHLKIKKADYGEIVVISTLKLFVLPLLILVPSYFLLGTDARNVGVFVAALPSAVLSLIVATNLKFDEDLAASAILVTTVLSTVTLIGWYIVLKVILV